MPINYPPGYSPAIPRSEAEVLAELDRRTGYAADAGRRIDPALASPAPGEIAVRPSKFIKYANRKKMPTPGLAYACGLNAAGKKRKDGK